MRYFIGVDVGGTTSTIAVGNEQRQLLLVSDQFSTRSAEGPAVTIEDIAQQIEASMATLGASLADVEQVSLATPGPATLDGVLLATPNLRADLWNRYPIRQALQDRLQRVAPDLEVSYIGDGQAAALGEFAIRTAEIDISQCPTFAHDHRVPQRSDMRSLFFIAVGTGLGGGEVRDGKVVRGAEGRAGHAGHLLLPHDAFRYEHDRKNKVGNAYCSAESAISLTALTYQLEYRLKLDAHRDHPLNAMPGTMKDKAKTLRQLCAQGDPLAVELLDDQAKALGIVMLMVNYIGDYDMLVIGGGVCDMSDSMRDRYIRIAEQSYYDHALDGFRNLDSLAFSICGDEASVLGSLRHSYD
ncbi:MAG: ROK family protein [Planctomycetaceae bacterium]